MPNQSWSETLITAIGDGPVLTTAAAASCLPPAAIYTMPAGFLQVRSALRIKASGRISSLITTPGTARFDVRMGGTVVFDSQAILLDTVAAHVNVGWVLDLLLTCRTVGNGTVATLFGQGTWTCEDILGVPATAPKGVLSAILPWNAAPAAGPGFNSMISNTVDLFFTQTVATGSMTLHQYALVSEN